MQNIPDYSIPHHSYLNETAISKIARKQKLRTIVGGVLTVFFGLSVILAAVGYSPELRDGLLIYVILLIPSVLLLLLGIRAGRDIALARRYNGIFAADRDGVVHASELTGAAGKPEAHLSKELERLFRLGLFQGCTLEQGASPAVILADEKSFVVVDCPQCGASNRIRARTHAKCEYCGSAICG